MFGNLIEDKSDFDEFVALHNVIKANVIFEIVCGRLYFRILVQFQFDSSSIIVYIRAQRATLVRPLIRKFGKLFFKSYSLVRSLYKRILTKDSLAKFRQATNQRPTSNLPTTRQRDQTRRPTAAIGDGPRIAAKQTVLDRNSEFRLNSGGIRSSTLSAPSKPLK